MLEEIDRALFDLKEVLALYHAATGERARVHMHGPLARVRGLPSHSEVLPQVLVVLVPLRGLTCPSRVCTLKEAPTLARTIALS